MYIRVTSRQHVGQRRNRRPNRHTALARTSNPIHSTLVPTVHRASPRRPGRTWRTPSRRRHVYTCSGVENEALVRANPCRPHRPVGHHARADSPARVAGVGRPEVYRYRKQWPSSMSNVISPFRSSPPWEWLSTWARRGYGLRSGRYAAEKPASCKAPHLLQKRAQLIPTGNVWGRQPNCRS